MKTAYFDNAATTFPKPDCVYDFMFDFYKNSGGSYGRGQHAKAISSGNLVNETRGKIRDLLHCPAKQVVFTPSATIALNIIISGLIKRGAKNIYISPFEHNAVTRVLHSYEKENTITVNYLPVESDYSFNIEKTKYFFESCRPDLVIMCHASNVIGLITPVEAIFRLAKQFNAFTLVDMAQTAGLVDMDLGKNCFDFAVFAGHKTLLGPTGISGFIMKPEIDLPPTIYGGTGFESANQDMPNSLPEKFEMGTQNIVGIAGLNASLKWIEAKGISSIWEMEHHNRNKLISILKNYSFLQPIGVSSEHQYVGIVSCLFKDISSDSAGMIFNERGIAVRTGLHCAPSAHKFIGTFPAGTIRFSVSCLTTDDDFNQLIDVLDAIEDEL